MKRLLIGLTALLLLASACRADLPLPQDIESLPTVAAVASAPPTEAATAPPTALPSATLPPPTTEPTAAPAATATTEPTPTEPAAPRPGLPAGVLYDLGEATIIQGRFPADSRFREMPVRLNGVMAVPDGEPSDGSYPVVLILHGTHPGCPLDEHDVDRWPCDPEVEQPNYLGFEYLVRDLAARGYVALSININAENTFGFGEPIGAERLEQIVDLHLRALTEAAAGGTNNFGVDLAGVADMRRLAFFGHSRGGEGANWLATEMGMDAPLVYADRGYGPVAGLLLIAPAMSFVGTNGSDVPLAVILPGCDGDVTAQEGQLFYEAVRLSEGENAPATTVFLERATHNGFNTILGSDFLVQTDRADCQPLLEPDVERQFLVDYAADFLTTLFDPDPAARLEAIARLGMDAAAPAPDALYDLPARVSAMPAAADRLPIFTPASEADLTTNRLGGAIASEGLTTLFCREGYYLAEENPGADPCRRPTVTVPGYPAMAVVNWEAPGALRFALPEGTRDLSRFTALSLRAAVDPLSPLNAAGAPQVFDARLTDGAGNSAVVRVVDEPALQFPIGETSESEFFGPLFGGRVPMTTIRLPLERFAGVDLGDVTEVALLFGAPPTGTLFLGDVEFIRRPALVGATSTLLTNGDGANDALRGVARFNGVGSCTGAFVAPVDAAGAPAYLLTNGHCAQEWDANRVVLDVPVEGWSATFNYFADTVAEQVVVPATRVAYSTMKGRDVAFVELDATVGELREQGITPFVLAAAEPEEAFTMRVVGAPAGGVPPAAAYLREEYCPARGRADLLEFIWHFDDALPNVCRDIYGGSSGSPVFVADSTGTPVIVALINTTNLGAMPPCALGSPCEARPGGVVWVADTSYATPVAGLRACFDAAGVFDRTAAGCPLDDGRQLLIGGYATMGTRNPIPTADGGTAPATWNATLTGDLPYYRYKTGRAGEIDCRAGEGYGPVVALVESALIDDPLPVEEGNYLLCVVAGESAAVDGTWQPAAWATVARVEVDNTPPTLEPRLSINRDGAGGFFFEPIFVVPELSDFAIKFGPAAETDCAVREAYLPYRRIPLRIPAEQVPARICVIGFDSPGNEGEALDVVVGGE